MHVDFDKKWGSKILTAVVLFISAYTLFSYIDFPPDAEANDSSEGLYGQIYEKNTEALFEAAGMNANDDSNPNWDNIFGSTGNENGKNLYLLIYNKVKVEPADAALETTAEYFGYSTKDMQDVVNGNLYALKEFDTTAAIYEHTSNVSAITSLLDRYDVVMSFYEQELALETLNSELTSQSLVKEMFANGDTSDSGFDLITDLQIIEYILFGGVNEEGYGTSGGSGFGSSASDSDSSSSRDGSSDGSSEDSESSSGSSSDFDYETTSLDDDEDDEFSSRAECFEDTDLERSLNAFLDGQSYSDGYVENVSGNVDLDDGISGNSGNGDGENTGSNASSDLQAPDAADWSRETPCSDFFCLEINFVTEADEPAYEETTNCVACHFSYIGEAVNQVVEHGLTRNKLTGNVMEDPSCKEDGAKILPSFSVFLVGNPILTPKNDDAISAIDLLGTRIRELFGADPEDDDPTLSYKDSDINAAAVTGIKGGQTLSETTEDIVALTEQEFEQRARDIQELATATQMANMTETYQSLSYEMDQMNLYFQSIMYELNEILMNLETIQSKE